MASEPIRSSHPTADGIDHPWPDRARRPGAQAQERYCRIPARPPRGGHRRFGVGKVLSRLRPRLRSSSSLHHRNRKIEKITSNVKRSGTGPPSGSVRMPLPPLETR